MERLPRLVDNPADLHALARELCGAPWIARSSTTADPNSPR